jgi:hypothetical protein
VVDLLQPGGEIPGSGQLPVPLFQHLMSTANAVWPGAAQSPAQQLVHLEGPLLRQLTATDAAGGGRDKGESDQLAEIAALVRELQPLTEVPEGAVGEGPASAQRQDGVLHLRWHPGQQPPR